MVAVHYLASKSDIIQKDNLQLKRPQISAHYKLEFLNTSVLPFLRIFLFIRITTNQISLNHGKEMNPFLELEPGLSCFVL